MTVPDMNAMVDEIIAIATKERCSFQAARKRMLLRRAAQRRAEKIAAEEAKENARRFVAALATSGVYPDQGGGGGGVPSRESPEAGDAPAPIPEPRQAASPPEQRAAARGSQRPFSDAPWGIEFDKAQAMGRR